MALLGAPTASHANPPTMDGRTDLDRDGEIVTDVGLDDDKDSQPSTGLPSATPTEGTPSRGANQNGNGDERRYIFVPAPGHSGDGDDGNYGWCQSYESLDVTDMTPAEEEQAVASATLTVQVTFQNMATMRGWGDEVDANAACPNEAVLGSLSAPLAENAVRDFITQQLPRPEPRIPPGYALTGLAAYLVTEHELEYGPESTTLDFGVMTAEASISATGATTVDWGDGTVETYDVVGTPYPDGQVKHTYTDRGTVTVSIIDTWTVSYDIADGTLTGTLTADLDTVSIGEFEVREYQAVRVSP